ncbi:MAG: PaaI family thioesterase [Oscillibacter sp.]|nr:PaaI family thioesterase [Oscillibacter sp.]
MEQLTAAQQAAELNKKNLFATYNHIEAEFVEPDHAIFKLEIRPESKNPYGIVHGGAIYTMADNATGYAAHTDGRSYVTQGSSMHFLRNQSEGVVRADAKVRHRGRTTCLVNVDILGEGGKLLATGEFTYFCIDPDIMAQKAAQHRGGGFDHGMCTALQFQGRRTAAKGPLRALQARCEWAHRRAGGAFAADRLSLRS